VSFAGFVRKIVKANRGAGSHKARKGHREHKEDHEIKK
jgi:hypothetical protein